MLWWVCELETIYIRIHCILFVFYLIMPEFGENRSDGAFVSKGFSN